MSETMSDEELLERIVEEVPKSPWKGLGEIEEMSLSIMRFRKVYEYKKILKTIQTLQSGEQIPRKQILELTKGLRETVKSDLMLGETIKKAPAKTEVELSIKFSEEETDKITGIGKCIRELQVGTERNIDNYQKVLEGITITTENFTVDNLKTLAIQRISAEKYEDEFLRTFLVIASTLPENYQFPIAEDSIQKMNHWRNKVLESEKKYIKSEKH